MKSIRGQGFSIIWPNGLELKKTTRGRGINRKEGMDLTPDEELINALWGWDGKVGFYLAYVPAERAWFKNSELRVALGVQSGALSEQSQSFALNS